MAFRSLLFVPGNRSDRHEKAAAAGADAVCLDLEDAVAPDQKSAARVAALAFLKAGSKASAIGLRINAVATDDGARDLDALAASKAPAAFVMLPKVESAGDIARVRARTTAPVWALMETPEAYFALPNIARAVGENGGILFGGADFSAAIGSDMSWDALLAARSAVVAAAALSGCSTLDVPWLDVKDEVGLVADTKRVKALGFQGRAAIYPPNVASINAIFTPTSSEVARAQAIVAAFKASGAAAALLDGKLIEKPILRAAERVLAAAR
jgi:citrate lyase subunit beta/citryl-CoA lyase/(S)-citramalyl-CoA lyase